MFTFVGLKDLREVLPASCPEGSALQYPPLLCYGVAVTARIWGSQRKALTELRTPGLWAQVCRDYSDLTGTANTLPTIPPTEAHQDNFIKWLTSDPERMAALSAEFTITAIGQARHQGNFPDTRTLPDWSQPDPRHLVFGDGTVYKRYSNVVEVVDIETGEVTYPGSRATTGRPRVQRRMSNMRPDEKVKLNGVNYVTTTTWTRSGWVVLTNDAAWGAEVKAARRQITRLHSALGERLHTVVWDRAVHSVDVEKIFNRHRVLVVNKPVARAKNTQGYAGYTALPMSQDEAQRRFRKGLPLPVGVAVYQKNGDLEVVRSKYQPYCTWTGDGCTHELWVDDGALVAVRRDADHHYYKIATAAATDTWPIPTSSGNHLRVQWSLPCPTGREHRVRTTWQPRRTAKQTRTEQQQALELLRPLPRADRRFSEVHGLRNNTESYHSWLKARLGTGTGHRAMRLDTDAQFIDHLCTGTLANALSAYRDQLHYPEDYQQAA